MDLGRNEHAYRTRVARAVAAIVADPLAEHRLEDLARLAHFSPFHFHRVYVGVVGETVAATVRRVRLAQATQLLESGDRSVFDVALAVGYDSPQAFTRAFGQFTGQSPRAFRQHMADTPPAMSDICIVKQPAQRLQALRHRGPFATIPHTHRRLYLHAGSRSVTGHWGLSFGATEGPDGYRYYAALASSDPWPADGEVERLDVPAGLYAVHRLAGPYTRINATVRALYARWLPASGYEPDERPMLEHYLSSAREVAPDQLRTDLMVPIREASTA